MQQKKATTPIFNSRHSRYESSEQSEKDKNRRLINTSHTKRINSSNTQNQNNPKSNNQITQKNFKKNHNNSNNNNRICLMPRSVQFPYVSASHWSIYDANQGVMLYGQRCNQQVEIASLTKIMTCLVTINFLSQFDLDPEKVYITISGNSSETMGTTANLIQGDQLSVKNLLYGLMLPSGNDAAIALAEGIGSLIYYRDVQKDYQLIKKTTFIPSRILKEKNKLIQNCQIQAYKLQLQQQIQQEYFMNVDKIELFIKEMNKFSGLFGLQKTNFSVVHGLRNYQNISTAKDIGALSCQAIKDPLIREIVNHKEYTCHSENFNNNQKRREYTWKNTNKLLQNGFLGLKTGITDSAGPCLSSYFKYQLKDQQYTQKIYKNFENIDQNFFGENNQLDLNLIIIVLNCESMESRWQETVRLKDWALKRYYHIDEQTENKQNLENYQQLKQ